jgi:hypothetical protein
MGIFKSRWNDETYLMTSFQMIAVAIDVSAHTQIAKAMNVEVADLWALYFWTLAPLKNSQKVSPELFQLLKYVPGNPMQPNLTETHKFPSSASFLVKPENYPEYVSSVSELTAGLKEKYMTKDKFVDETFAQELTNDVTDILQRTMPDRVSSSTQAIACVAALALRSILKESNSLNRQNKKKVRNSGIFWISMIIVDWHFKRQ